MTRRPANSLSCLAVQLRLASDPAVLAWVQAEPAASSTNTSLRVRRVDARSEQAIPVLTDVITRIVNGPRRAASSTYVATPPLRAVV